MKPLGAEKLDGNDILRIIVTTEAILMRRGKRTHNQRAFVQPKLSLQPSQEFRGAGNIRPDILEIQGEPHLEQDRGVDPVDLDHLIALAPVGKAQTATVMLGQILHARQLLATQHRRPPRGVTLRQERPLRPVLGQKFIGGVR